MKSELCLQPVSHKEACEKVAALADTIWHECYATVISKGQIDYMVETFQAPEAIFTQITEEGFLYYLVEIQGQQGGYLALQPKEGALFISKVYLLCQWRGKGYREELFSFIAKTAATYGCKSYWLTVNKENQRAIAAYKKQGMHIIREQVVDIGAGYVMDDYVFSKSR